MTRDMRACARPPTLDDRTTREKKGTNEPDKNNRQKNATMTRTCGLWHDHECVRARATPNNEYAKRAGPKEQTKEPKEKGTSQPSQDNKGLWLAA